MKNCHHLKLLKLRNVIFCNRESSELMFISVFSTVYFRESIFKKTCIKNARRDFFETLLHTVCCTLLDMWCVLGYFSHVQNFFQIETNLKLGNSRKYPYTTMDGFLEFQGQGGWGFFELEFRGQGEVLWTGRHGGVLTSGILKA